MKIEKKTIGEYITEGGEDIDFAIRFGEDFKVANDSIGMGDLTKCSFGLIKEILMDMENEFGFNEQISAMKKILREKHIRIQIMDMDLLQFVQQLNYMKEKLTEIVEAEIELLSNSSYDDIAEKARIGSDGKDLFEGIEVYLQLRQLANGDITKISEVEKLPYEDCLLELYTRNQLSKFEDNYARLSRKK